MNPFAAFSFSLACFFGSVMVLSGQSPHYLAVLCYFEPFCYGFFSFIHSSPKRVYDFMLYKPSLIWNKYYLLLTFLWVKSSCYSLEIIIVKPLGSRFNSLSVLIGIIWFKLSKNFCIFSLA